MSELPKKRMLGIAAIAVLMIMVGAVTLGIEEAIRGYKTTVSFVSVLWVPVCWNAIKGDINSNLFWSKLGVFVQTAGMLLLVFTIEILGVESFGSDSSMFLLVGPALSLIFWVGIYLRISSVKKNLGLELANKSDQKELQNLEPEDIEINTKKHKKAMMIIEYNDEINSYWQKIKEGQLSLELQTKFLNALEKNPKLNVGALYTKLMSEEIELRRPFKDKEVNDAYESALLISPSAAEEFKNVYETLGESLTCAEIFGKVRKKYLTKDLILTPTEIEQLRFFTRTNQLDDLIQVLSEIGYTFEKDSLWAGEFTRPFDGKVIRYVYTMGSTEVMDIFLNEINIIEQHSRHIKNS